ncbi:MAG: hypothetical protein IJS97_09115 [Prevotella sp.]|nr:hypothetical protein [Prevotella sp.]
MIRRTIITCVAAICLLPLHAQSVIFPQQDQPGKAVADMSPGGTQGVTYIIGNDLLTAAFTEKDNKLSFNGCEEMGLKGGTELFKIRLGTGAEVKASEMTLEGVSLIDLEADPTAVKGSLRYAGKALEAKYTYKDMKFTWRAVLRDGSHYLRTELKLTSSKDVSMNAVIPMMYNVDNNSSKLAPAVVGNTRGAVIASDRIFAGLETPMGINTTGGNTSAEPFVFNSWNGNKFKWIPGEETPQGIRDLGLTPDYISGVQGYLAIKTTGTHTVKFQYTSGSHRLDIAGVDALDPFTGEVIAHDYHKGTTGGSSSNNTYTLNIPQKGYYLIRYFRDCTEEVNGTVTGSFNSNGTITWSGKVSAPQIVFDGNTDLNVLQEEGEEATGLQFPVLAVGGKRTDSWNTSSWTTVTKVPARIVELGFSNPYVKVMGKTIAFNIAGGTLNAEFVYSAGANGLSIVGVELIDADNNVAASDYHKGFSGNAKTDNNYTFTVPASGDYRIRYFIENQTEANTSTGNIQLTYNIIETLHLPAPETTPIQGEWSRQTKLLAGKEWNVGTVVGLVAEGQQRRSFLAYSERERAVPWRPFPLYNSWYELNINRNNDRNYTGNYNEAQCLDVLNQWKTHLFDRYNTNIASFVWDDGWDQYGTWTFNKNFPNGFQNINELTTSMNSQIGAWLGPVGGYGQSGNYRREYWSSRGGMQLSNPAYYDVFLNACSKMVTDYAFNFFKFDGISAQFSSVGPDAGATGQENAEGIIDIERRIREIKPDVFFNTTVGTWASPFWFNVSDAVWRQENDYGTIGNQGSDRERWITYRDRLVYQNFVQNSPLCPINTLMTHGFILTNFGSVSTDMTYAGVLRELRCAFACGSGMVEVYADYSLMNSINNGKLWQDLAECIEWQKQQADVLPDIHWVGGNPWDGAKANVYGWASWNGKKATLALRNPSATAQKFTTTLRQALDIPDYVSTSITLSKAFTQNSLMGLTTDLPIDIDTELTLTLPASSVFVFNGIDNASTNGIVEINRDSSANTELEKQQECPAVFDLQGRRMEKPARGFNIVKGKKFIVK